VSPPSAAVVTVSDRSAAGLRQDRSGPVLAEALRAAGWAVTLTVVPDGEDPVAAALRAALTQGSRLILTTGGTGVGPRDRTPEATAAVVDRIVPGIAEALRADGARHSAHAWLSRGVAGVVDATESSRGALIVNLPGSPAAVAEALPVLLPLVGHVLDQVEGGDHG
jgi:molybdenum cofactor synthesis domain-containing protein